MPRIEQVGDNGIVLYLSADDTYKWAHRPGRMWPCSRAADRHIKIHIDRDGNKGDIEVREPDTGYVIPNYYIPIDELDAIVTDHLPEGHPGRRKEGY